MVQRHFDHTVSTHLRCRRVHEDPNACAAMLLALSQLYASIVYPSIAAELPSPKPGALYGELASFCKVDYLMQRSIDVVKLLSNTTVCPCISSAAVPHALPALLTYLHGRYQTWHAEVILPGVQ